MPIQLAHFGEDLVQAMVCKLGQSFLELCPGFEAQKVTDPIAITEVPLERYAGLSFDGASRIDMVVLLEGNQGIPFEIKLGSTRLSKTRIDDEWLPDCKTSHPDKLGRPTRWSGNVMAVLERKFGVKADRGLCVVPDDRLKLQPIELTSDWFVIARERVIRSWEQPGAKPAFSANVKMISLESIVQKFEGDGVRGERFNALVRELLNFDFYNRWITGGEE